MKSELVSKLGKVVAMSERFHNEWNVTNGFFDRIYPTDEKTVLLRFDDLVKAVKDAERVLNESTEASDGFKPE